MVFNRDCLQLVAECVMGIDVSCHLYKCCHALRLQCFDFNNLGSGARCKKTTTTTTTTRKLSPSPRSFAGGRAIARVHGYSLSGFVDATDRFTTELDLKENYQFILNGHLDANVETGRLYHVREDLGTQGFSSKVLLEKSEI